MNDKYYVICGNRNEFQEFVTKKAADMWMNGTTSVSLSNFVFVHSSEQLRGQSCPHGWFFGTWRGLSNIKEIVLQLALSYATRGYMVPDNINNIAKELGLDKD